MYPSMLNYDAFATQDDGSCDGELSFVNSQIETAEAVLQASHDSTIDSLNNAHTAEVDGLEGEISILEAEITSLLAELVDANADIDNLNDSVSDLNDSIAVLNDVIDVLEEQILDLQSDISDLEQYIIDLNIAHQSEINDLTELCNIAIAACLSDCQIIIDGTNEVIAHQDSLISVYVAEITGLTIDVADLENELAIASNESATDSILIASLYSQIVQKNAQISSLSSSLAALQIVLATTDLDLTVAQDSIGVLVVNVTSLESALALEQANHVITQTALDSVELVLSATAHDLELANQEIASLEAQLALCIANGASANDSIVTLNDSIIALLDTIELKDVEIEALETEKTDLTSLVASLTADLAIADAEIVALTLSLTNLELELDALVAVNDSLEYIITTANDSIFTLNAQVDECEIALTDCLENPALIAIDVDLLSGWNIIGYTFAVPQDIVATFDDIDQYIQIVKNNLGQTYWPEYGFNGIGDLIPGQGYQLRLTEGILNYSFPVVDARIELTPTVPQWAIDMETLVHPNDIRTLVRVVNLTGQEVNPEYEIKGTVLLYMFNDGSVEKRLNQ